MRVNRRSPRVVVCALLAACGASLLLPWPSAHAACCYFAAKDKDVSQPGQKAFITYDDKESVETFTVQPRFEGNAVDFGMVIPTPGRPKLDEMPRDFFKELAVFTILEPMDLSKYKPAFRGGRGGGGFGGGGGGRGGRGTVTVLEAGIVGSLDYKIILAEKADDLYAWLKDNGYSYGGDEATLDFYIKKKWTFTVMKIDPTQMKKNADGTYTGDVTPTRFTFSSEQPVYPLKITQLSVKDRTEALLYIQAKDKMDLAGDLSYEKTFVPMWKQALAYALPEKITDQEKAWDEVTADFSTNAPARGRGVRGAAPPATSGAGTGGFGGAGGGGFVGGGANGGGFGGAAGAGGFGGGAAGGGGFGGGGGGSGFGGGGIGGPGFAVPVQGTTLEWAKRITAQDIALLTGDTKYNRQAPQEDIDKLKLLKGHVKEGQFITKIRRVFTKDDMNDDLRFVKAQVHDKADTIEYYSILPTSPP